TWALIARRGESGCWPPRAAPVGPDPVSWFPSLEERGGKKTKYRFVGYSTDDRRLGGPFIQDQRVAFRATADRPYYWRGEALDIYTGHGWEKNIDVQQLPVLDHLYPDPDVVVFDGDLLFHNMKAEDNRATIVWSLPRYHVLFAPGGLRRADPG